MSAAVAQKKDVGTWSETFPEQINTLKESVMFMKRLLGVAICNITYLRTMFPGDAYIDKSLEGVQLKILKSSDAYPQVNNLINCLKVKLVIKIMAIQIHPDVQNLDKVLDSYNFQFTYNDGNKIKKKKITTKISCESTKESTVSMLRRLIVMSSTLEPLPPVFSISMKLYYYDNADYEPPGFEPSDKETSFLDDPAIFDIGNVSTIYHTLTLQLATSTKETTPSVASTIAAAVKKVNISASIEQSLSATLALATSSASPTHANDQSLVSTMSSHYNNNNNNQHHQFYNQHHNPGGYDYQQQQHNGDNDDSEPLNCSMSQKNHNQRTADDDKVVNAPKRKADEDVRMKNDELDAAAVDVEKLVLKNPKEKKLSKSKYLQFGPGAGNNMIQEKLADSHGKSRRARK
ncbi:hypothetical protein HELRODRAFT_167292 [Helobdella robusta]|uniref:HORMA domain-containing protein n=1 Tax=Helobdella robusta TaxID=6412 RepID=T1EZ81_HELRO|nr:hypothetical protein HELRODRAFT_167292 [Helobdella robusta]ESO10793.1 hypothetical protein HELRODRAFT_167292 [Helobdella robusta]